MKLAQALSTPVQWAATQDPLAPWEAEVQASKWKLRMNDFPEEPLYTLFVDGVELGEVEDWPVAWSEASPNAKPHVKKIQAKKIAVSREGVRVR